MGSSWRESRQYSGTNFVVYTSMRDYLKYFATNCRRRLQAVPVIRDRVGTVTYSRRDYLKYYEILFF